MNYLPRVIRNPFVPKKCGGVAKNLCRGEIKSLGIPKFRKLKIEMKDFILNYH